MTDTRAATERAGGPPAGAPVVTYHRPGCAPRVVRQGFSWPAFLLGPLWALTKGLWAHALLMFVALALLALLEAYALHLHQRLLSYACLALQFALGAFYGGRGNALVERALRRRGFRRQGA